MRRKLERFRDNALRENVLEPGKTLYEQIQGSWHRDYFHNSAPIVVELACGRGEYTVGLAKLFPEKNFIGVDIKGDRIWKGSGIALEEGLGNIAFLRTEIQLLDKFFANGEISEIWITFPDPRPKDRDIKRRLTSPRFMEIYKKLISKGGWLRLKTDNTDLFQYTLDTLKEREDIEDFQSTFDLYGSELEEECHGIKTRFEEKFSAKGEDIKYLRFAFNPN